MPKLAGKDKSMLQRGLRSTRAEYGECGMWLGLPNKWEFEDGVTVQTFVLPTEEKTHIICVRADAKEREAVFRAMGATWSWSKHLASKVLCESVLERNKPMIWHHGWVTPRIIQNQINGFDENHVPDRPKKIPAPWIPKSRLEQVREYTAELEVKVAEREEALIKL